MTATHERPPGGSSPHPRFRERWAQRRRDEGRRRLHRLVAVAVVAVAALLGLGLSRSPLLDVDAVVVEGAGHTQPDQVVDAAGIDKGQAMVEVHGSAAAARVEALPWVSHAQVRRRWPGTVTVEVRERVAVAQVGRAPTGWFLVDGGGRLLATVDRPQPGLVRLAGSIQGRPGDDLGRRLAAARTVAVAVGPRLAPKITEIQEVDGELDLLLVGGGRVRFGPPEQVDEKLTTVDQLLVAAPRPCPLWDVRVPAAPALTPEKGCA